MPILYYRDPADGLFKPFWGGGGEVIVSDVEPTDPSADIWVKTIADGSPIDVPKVPVLGTTSAWSPYCTFSASTNGNRVTMVVPAGSTPTNWGFGGNYGSWKFKVGSRVIGSKITVTGTHTVSIQKPLHAPAAWTNKTWSPNVLQVIFQDGTLDSYSFQVDSESPVGWTFQESANATTYTITATKADNLLEADTTSWPLVATVTYTAQFTVGSANDKESLISLQTSIPGWGGMGWAAPTVDVPTAASKTYYSEIQSISITGTENPSVILARDASGAFQTPPGELFGSASAEVAAHELATTVNSHPQYLKKGGDFMNGGYLSQYYDPVDPLHTATKRYVDSRVGGWQDWTYARVDQGTSTNITHTVDYARYCRIGDMIHVIAAITFTGVGLNGSPIILTNLPSMLSTIMGKNVAIGTYDYIRSGLHHHTGAAQVYTGANCLFRSDGASGIGQSPAFALASGDLLTVNLIYPAA